MRLIGEFKIEKDAFGFQSFLQKEGIQSLYDQSGNAYRLWVIEEDDFDKAFAFYQEWLKDPQHARYIAPPVQTPPPAETSSGPTPKWKVKMDAPKQGPSFSFTNIIIIICLFLFIIDTTQKFRIEQQKGQAAIELGLTPLETVFLFDYPQYLQNFQLFLEEYPIRSTEEIKELSAEGQQCFKKVENAPTWKGIADLAVEKNWKGYEALPAGTLFGKIRQGEVWRLITPVFLHANFLHILFNMAWLWVLGRQIENRLGVVRLGILSLLIGVISNVAQYLVSGPIFLGYSGIVVGMVGFIWVRQKKAPWEGYPLQRSVVIFILVFVLAMLGLEVFSMGLHFFHVTEAYVNIANTAHIVGGLSGMLLARVPYFARRAQ